MKLTLPMLWSALIVFAALVLMPWMLMPATPDPSPVLESIRGRLERMTHLLEQQNRLLASSGQAGGLAGLAQGGSGAPGPGGWQPNAVRASLQTHRQRNDVVPRIFHVRVQRLAVEVRRAMCKTNVVCRGVSQHGAICSHSLC